MATLENKLVKNTYKDLLKLSAGDNEGLNGSTLITIEDGEGTDSALQISTAGIKSTGTLAVDGTSTLTGNTTIGGTLGVGVTTNTWNTSVNAAQISKGISFFGNSTTPYGFISNNHYWGNDGDKYLVSGYGASYLKQYNGELIFSNAPSGTSGDTISFTERFKIDSSGNVGIGTTPSYQLHLSTDSAAKPTSNTWTVSSDMRIKENIELANLQTCFENVKNLKLKRFTYKNEIFSNEQVKDRTQLGFIAQEVEPIFPKAISKNDLKYNQKYEDVIIPAKFDEDGIEIEAERTEKKLISEDVIENCYGLDSSQIIWALYGAVQHLIAKVEALESR